MIFSVFDPYRRTYDYYEAPGTSADYGLRGTKYRTLNGHPQGPVSHALSGGQSRTIIGFAPEALATRLPEDARRVGSGREARGAIAVASGAMSGFSSGFAGGSGGIAGLGEVAPATKDESSLNVVGFGEVVLAGVIASIVGVLVQKVISD